MDPSIDSVDVVQMRHGRGVRIAKKLNHRVLECQVIFLMLYLFIGMNVEDWLTLLGEVPIAALPIL